VSREEKWMAHQMPKEIVIQLCHGDGKDKEEHDGTGDQVHWTEKEECETEKVDSLESRVKDSFEEPDQPRVSGRFSGRVGFSGGDRFHVRPGMRCCGTS